MNWKRYKSFTNEQKQNEIYYIIGLDLGNDSSGMAFYNMRENAPETIDLSGGYGHASVPTVVQYIPATREWVCGEYALLNRGLGTEITFTDLIERLGRHEYVDIGEKPVSLVSLLGIFIKEMLSHVKNINPKAEIAGIVAAVPGYFSEQAKEELTRAFKAAGYEKELIALVSDRECVFSGYCHHRVRHPERVLLLDYGSREVRGGLYDIVPQGDGAQIKSMSSLFDEEIGMAHIHRDTAALFNQFYAEHTRTEPKNWSKQINEQLSAFTHQHKNLLFQKNIRKQPVKLYFNFAFPPFQQTVGAAHTEKLTEPYRRRFAAFVREVLSKNLYAEGAVAARDIQRVLCVGGGFEMRWAREAVEAMFPRKVDFYKNAKAVMAEGAAVAAAGWLDAAEGLNIVVEDKHQLRADIGLQSAGGLDFLPLAERNSFWWQKRPVRKFLINRPCEGVLPLQLARRDVNGEMETLAVAELDLPERPKGTTRLSAALDFSSDTELTVIFKDEGFGEWFPAVDYEKVVTLSF